MPTRRRAPDRRRRRRRQRDFATAGSAFTCWLALAVGTSSTAAADPGLAGIQMREHFLEESRAAQARLSAQQAATFGPHPEGFAQVSELLLPSSGTVVMVNGERHGSAKSLGETDLIVEWLLTLPPDRVLAMIEGVDHHARWGTYPRRDRYPATYYLHRIADAAGWRKADPVARQTRPDVFELALKLGAEADAAYAYLAHLFVRGVADQPADIMRLPLAEQSPQIRAGVTGVAVDLGVPAGQIWDAVQQAAERAGGPDEIDLRATSVHVTNASNQKSSKQIARALDGFNGDAVIVKLGADHLPSLGIENPKRPDLLIPSVGFAASRDKIVVTTHPGHDIQAQPTSPVPPGPGLGTLQSADANVEGDGFVVFPEIPQPLTAHPPTGDDSRVRPAIVHGDFRRDETVTPPVADAGPASEIEPVRTGPEFVPVEVPHVSTFAVNGLNDATLNEVSSTGAPDPALVHSTFTTGESASGWEQAREPDPAEDDSGHGSGWLAAGGAAVGVGAAAALGFAAVGDKAGESCSSSPLPETCPSGGAGATNPAPVQAISGEAAINNATLAMSSGYQLASPEGSFRVSSEPPPTAAGKSPGFWTRAGQFVDDIAPTDSGPVVQGLLIVGALGAAALRAGQSAAFADELTPEERANIDPNRAVTEVFNAQDDEDGVIEGLPETQPGTTDDNGVYSVAWEDIAPEDPVSEVFNAQNDEDGILEGVPEAEPGTTDDNGVYTVAWEDIAADVEADTGFAAQADEPVHDEGITYGEPATEAGTTDDNGVYTVTWDDIAPTEEATALPAQADPGIVTGEPITEEPLPAGEDMIGAVVAAAEEDVSSADG